MTLFCRHVWKEVKTVTAQSPIEMLAANNIVTEKGPGWFFIKKTIVILACEKCGKLDKTRIDNY